ncbi:MAG: hypothetical protein M3Y74_07040 [Chloroflexota bacterium]|nr:hypothetical protein [Chloroflexota bacterium]
MIQERDVIPLFLDACPSFQPIWEQHRAYWGDEDAGGYIDMSEIARHLVELMREKHTEYFSSAFAIIERLIVEGEDNVQGLAIVGVLEDLQNIAANTNVDPEKFLPWLGPKSGIAWAWLNQLWEGKSNLMDVLREETRDNSL